jgi:hypothetical protein
MLVGRCLPSFPATNYKPKQKKVTSSERSASQIYRVRQRLVARSRRTPTVLISSMPAPGGPATRSFPEVENKNCGHLAMSGGWRFEKKLSLIRTIHPEFDHVLRFRWSKSSERHG